MRKFDIVFPIRNINTYKRISKATKEHRALLIFLIENLSKKLLKIYFLPI